MCYAFCSWCGNLPSSRWVSVFSWRSFNSLWSQTHVQPKSTWSRTGCVPTCPARSIRFRQKYGGYRFQLSCKSHALQEPTCTKRRIARFADNGIFMENTIPAHLMKSLKIKETFLQPATGAPWLLGHGDDYRQHKCDEKRLEYDWWLSKLPEEFLNPFWIWTTESGNRKTVLS